MTTLTSRLAFAELDTVTCRAKVLKTLRRHPSRGLSRQEISYLSGLPINNVCGRVSELIDDGVIYVWGNRKNKLSGKLNQVLKVKK